MITYGNMLCSSIYYEIKSIAVAKECICNAGKMRFDAIEFGTKSSRIEIICGKCRGIICWWLINTEQFVPLASHRTKKYRQLQQEPQIKAFDE